MYLTQTDIPTPVDSPMRPSYSSWFRLRVCAVYAIVAILWIFTSDMWLSIFVGHSPTLLAQLGSLKGIGFIALTTLALYGVLSLEQRRRRVIETALKQDILKRRAAEAARLQLASIVEASDDAIISVDLTGIITSWNKGAERIYGYRASEVIGQPLSRITPEAALQDARDMLMRVGQGQSIYHYEVPQTCQDGSTRHIIVNASPMYDANQTIIGASAIGRDITDYKRALEKIKVAECAEAKFKKEREILDLKAELSQIVSQEFGTPLTVITLATELLTEHSDMLTPEKTAKKLQEIQTEAEHMSNLLDKIWALGDSLIQSPDVRSARTSPTDRAR
jgi:PAS domain S-box-containing protein